MAQYELSVSPDYVPDWTVTDAVREIFQNALDQQMVNPANKMEWNFSIEDQYFEISSKDSRLTKDTLLFGNSTKRADIKTIGMFGEGYKLALLVLCRLGYEVTINNYAENEVWIPRIIQSRRYKSKLLVIDINKHIFKNSPDNNLTFCINGIEADAIADIGRTNLHMKPPKNTIETPQGRILRDKIHKGEIFINGLFVSKNERFHYGYDAKPEFLTIGRDRNLINSFDLSWLTGQMWNAAGKPGIVAQMLHKGAPDTTYIKDLTSSGGELAQTMYAEFTGSYGKLAIPVSNQEEYDTIKKSYKKLKPIIVKENIQYIIQPCCEEKIRTATKRRDTRLPYEILKDFSKKIKKYIPLDEKNEFDKIMKKSYNWTFKE